MKRSFALVATLLLCIVAMAQQPKYLDVNAPMEERIDDALSRMTTHEKIKVLHAQSKFTSAGVPRLGIRQLNMDDGPHGVREELEWNTWMPARWTNDFIVAFPSLTCLAATWNRDLSATYGNAVSEEFAFREKDLMLGPGVNIQRTPYNGRAFEYMGEDPLLAGEMCVPYIQAAQKNGVGCCLKHFVLNDQEIDRFNVNVNVSERALREIYLAPFKRAVEKAHVWSIMGSYNLWKGDHCCHNAELLNGILKGEWNWDGAIVSDWGGTTNTLQAATDGLDIEMGSYTDGKLKESEYTYDDYYLARPFEKLINDGKLPMSVLDEKVRRVLRLIFRTAMNPSKVIGSQCSEAHYDACRQIGEEGIVLLKNGPAAKKRKGAVKENLLPLTAEKLSALAKAAGKADGSLRVLIVGENATRSLTQGGGSSELKTLRDVSPLEAISEQLKALCPQVQIEHAQGYASGRPLYDRVDAVDPAENVRLAEEAVAKAREADLVLFIGGMNKNNRQDCENSDREGYDLSFGQNELITRIASQSSGSLVVITFGGNPYAMPWLAQASALLHCWYLGSESGNALANVLTGKVNPSGKLPVTFARNAQDYPFAKYGEEAYPGITGVKVEPNSAGETPNRQVYYKEDIYMGYRGFERDKVKPLFPFGFGLSYTSFKYSKPVVSGNSVSIDVTNTGSCAGKEVVQLYIGKQKPAEDRPRKELKDFRKIQLQPGETKTVTFNIDSSELAYFSTKSNQWVTEKGKYRLYLASSSADEGQQADYVLN
ncbi:MAG: glycoside hydrolase family 3 C-terminal domain-containing protein [Prevotella sp.]|nr:glycoside hydrolase family 3 C-terminal domain-containing protein [Prevotella sp.]